MCKEMGPRVKPEDDGNVGRRGLDSIEHGGGSPCHQTLTADHRMKAVFTPKAGSIYDDLPEERYHFPETYLRQAEATVGDFVIYYEPGRMGTHDRGRHGRRAYVAAAQVTGIRPDPVLMPE